MFCINHASGPEYGCACVAVHSAHVMYASCDAGLIGQAQASSAGLLWKRGSKRRAHQAVKKGSPLPNIDLDLDLALSNHLGIDNEHRSREALTLLSRFRNTNAGAGHQGAYSVAVPVAHTETRSSTVRFRTLTPVCGTGSILDVRLGRFQ